MHKVTAENTPKDRNKNSKQNEKERGVLEDLRKKMITMEGRQAKES